MSIRSIRFELAFWYSVVMAVTILIVGVAFERIAYNRISASMDNSLRLAAHEVLNEIRLLRGDVGRTDVDSATTILNQTPWSPRYVQILDRDLRVVYRSRNLGRYGLPIDTARTIGLERGMRFSPDMKLDNNEPIRMITFRFPEYPGSPVRWGQVALSLHDLPRARRKNRLALAFTLPAGIAISGLFGWWLARRALRPIDDLTRKARRIRAENLHERIPRREVDDELGRLIETLNDMFERLEQNFRQITRFSADASHELRTPLTIIQGEAEVALKASVTREEAQAALEVILDEARRMSALVRNLLTLARLESGEQRPRLERIALRPVVDDLAEEARYLAEAKGIELNLGPIDAAEVYGDAVLLHQLGFNLLDNATKYTPSGGSISLSLRASGAAANLIVSDTGVGIDPSEAPFIFDRFYRSAKTRNMNEGSGLGLSLVKHIVEIHRGTVRVMSEPGRGSEFVVSLPLAAQRSAERGENGTASVTERTVS